MRKIYIVILFSFIFTGNLFSQNKFINDSLYNYVNNALKLWNIPGAAVVVVKDGKVIIAKGFGVKEMNTNNKVDANTLFMIASNTKAFTATALCLLDKEKQISLDDRVVKWMPDFRLYDSVLSPYVTIRDLLCHRLGLMTFQGDFVNWCSNLSKQEIIHNFRNLKPVYDFRARYGYCNMAFLTAGEIIPIVTGKSWEEYVTEYILKPLEMNRSFLKVDAMKNEQNVSRAHTVFNDSLLMIPYDEIDNLGPAASLCTSVNDIAHWLIMQTDSGRYNGKQIIPYSALLKTIIPNMSIGLNQNNIYKGMKHLRAYGLGWQLEDYSNRLMVSHTGGVNGFVTSTCFLPEERLGIAVFTNTDVNSLYEALKYQIIDSYLNLPYRNYSNLFYELTQPQNIEARNFIKKEKEIVGQNNKTDLELDSYTGKYFNNAYGEIEIKNENSKLIIYFSRHLFLKGNLEARGGNSFLCKYSHPGFGMKVINFKTEQNKVISVKISVNEFIDYMEYEFNKSN